MAKSKTKKRFRWKVIGVTIVAIYAVYLILVFFLQHYAIFPGQFNSGESAEKPAYLKAQKVGLECEFGVVPMWFFPVDNAPGCILITHGNAELASNWFDRAEDLVGSGFAVAVLEYPGYGSAEGAPSQKSVGVALDAAYDHVASLGFTGREIVGLGYSIGTGTICDLSTRRELGALVLIAPFKSMKAMFLRYLAPPFVLRSPLDNELALKKFDGSVLIYHGTEDTLIPHSHGEHLASLKDQFELHSLKAGHVDIQNYWYSEMLPGISGFFRGVVGNKVL